MSLLQPIRVPMLLAAQVHSFTGQMAEWVSTFLEAPVSLIDLINDTHALGAAHDPAAFMKRPRETDVRCTSAPRQTATNPGPRHMHLI